VLLVTGPLCLNMREALLRSWACTPEPKWVVAAGDCAVDGGVFKGSPAIEGGIREALAVDLVIPGCPPTPTQLLEGLLALLEAQSRPAPAARR
jgi:Ni,Fe-hydrogenase III small subunit